MAETEMALAETTSVMNVGRYVLHRQIARGGMATIHIARLMGDEGFSRIVAAKRLLPEFAEDSDFVAMFLDEARIASKVHHRNVVPVLDVVTAMDEVVLVQEYVHGAPLHWLLNRVRQAQAHVPVPVAVSIATQVLAGLHAAHEMTDELGTPLEVVHRDVSPQNVMIAVDGTARLLDFGVAKATMAAHITREGTYKGKLAYSAPEQLRGAATRQSDLYSLAVMLWELLVGHRMHGGQGEAELVATIMNGTLPSITETLAAEHEWSSIDETHWQMLAALEPIVKRGLAVDLQKRWATAVDMEEALVAAVRPASASMVAAWLKANGKDYLDKHDKVLAAEEASWRRTVQSTIRRTSLPSARHGTKSDEPSAGSRTLPPAPNRRGPQALIALLSLLVVALAVGIVLIVRTPTAQSQAAAATVTPVTTPAASPPAAPVAKVAPREQLVEPAEAEPATAAEPAPDDEISLGRVETRPTTAAPPPRRIMRAPVRTVTRTRAPVAPPIPVEAPKVEKKDGCTPPYYFEGTKKIFKPACL